MLYNFFYIFGIVGIFSVLAANPKDPRVVFGEVRFEQSGDVLHVITRGRVVIHWNDFSLAPGEMTFFLQENEESAVLNRVEGRYPSALYGLLESNGSVYLINPNGVLIGDEGEINAGGFIASTHDFLDASFVNNENLNFKGDSQAAIVNFGHIEASEGDVVLMAYVIENRGELIASEGYVSLVAGKDIIYQPQGAPRTVIIAKEGEAVRVDNRGHISAVNVELKADAISYIRAINQEGTIEASHIVLEGGRVLIIDELAAGNEDDFIVQLLRK